MSSVRGLVRIVSTMRESLGSILPPPSAGPQERVSLVSNVAHHPSMDRGDTTEEGGDAATSSSQELRGLTAEYVNWFESTTALKYALGNFVAYLMVAVVGYSFVFEGWEVYDSVYFAMVVFTTVGYGDLSPSTSISRAFTVCFALYGIIILGIFLGVVGEYIIERNEESMKKRLSNARLRVLQQFGNDDTALPPEERSWTNKVMAIIWAETPVVLLLIILGTPILILEDWDLDKGIYWMVVTGTTIGFGDLEPTQTITRIICILWIPLAVAVTGGLLGRIATAFIDRYNDTVEDKFLQRAMTLADLGAMDNDCDSRVSPEEFLRYMLVALQKVEKEDIDEIMAIFRKFDKDNSGYIEKEDLQANYNFALRPGVTITSTR